MKTRRLPHDADELPRQFARIHMGRVIWIMSAPLFPDPSITFYQVWCSDGLVIVRAPSGFTLAMTDTDNPDKAVLMIEQLHV